MTMTDDLCRIYGGKKQDTNGKPLPFYLQMGQGELGQKYPKKHYPHRARTTKMSACWDRFIENCVGVEGSSRLSNAARIQPKPRRIYTLVVDDVEFASFTDSTEAWLNSLSMKSIGDCKTEVLWNNTPHAN